MEADQHFLKKSFQKRHQNVCSLKGQGQIVKKVSELEEMKSLIVSQGIQLAEKERLLQQKNAQILEQEKQLAEKCQELAQQIADIGGRNVALYCANQDLAEKEEELARLNNYLAVKCQKKLVKMIGLLVEEVMIRKLLFEWAVSKKLMAFKIARSGLFDRKWYLQHNPDIANSRLNPLLHFINCGGAEGRDPHPLFSSKLYLKKNLDVKLFNINPLFHYLTCGKKEGRGRYTSLEQIEYGKKNRDIDKTPSFSIACNIEEGIVFKDDIRAIALYLPQFHEIKENNEWWGKGFTEWTNVKRGLPFYIGHYQPHVPHPDVSYYSLDDASVLEKQAEMALQHGIHGFCFYYYWFNGKRLLEKPLDRLLASGKPNFPFCFCWANENWTRTWDGGDKEILMEQTHSYENDERFIQDLIPVLKDPRYIRVNNKPLFIIYRPGLLPDMKATAKHWREVCRKEGVGEIYLACMRSFGFFNPLEHGLDAAIQFPPAGVPAKSYSLVPEMGVKEGFAGHIFDAEEMRSFYSREEASFPLIRSVCPSWDNTARRMERATSWINATPTHYYHWLSQAVKKTEKDFKKGERFVFINAWNEWGEGCHLEPDSKYGYAWLNATKKALQANTSPATSKKPYLLIVSHDAARAGAQIVLLNLLKEWKKSNEFQIKIICVKGGILYSEFESLFPTLLLEALDGIKKENTLKDFIELQPDLIYSNTVVNGQVLTELKSEYSSCPVITHVHELQKSIERWASGAIMEATITSTDHFIAVSKEVKNNLEASHKIASSRISKIQPGIPIKDPLSDVTLKFKLQAELGIKEGEFVCFGCGTTDWRKGPDLFVKTARQVLLIHPGVRFIWIGSKNLQEFPGLEEKIQEWGLRENIQFVGERISPREYFSLGDVFFLSSREDPFPLVALEAADTKLPIVCFERAGGMPEFVAKDAGIIVPYESTAAAANAIISLINDQPQRSLFGKNAQEKVGCQNNIRKIAAQIGLLIQEKILESKDAPALVSVIVPNYNHAPYLEERLKSIAKQTYTNLEIIILDDASSDNSKEVIELFVKKEPRARALYNESNSGSPFKQWSKGIEASSGKYIWIAESDDSADHHLVEELVRRLEEDASLSLATCQLVMMDKTGSLGGTPDEWLSEFNSDRWKVDYINTGIDEIRHFLSKKNTILNASGVIIRNFESLADLIDDSMRFCADWLLWVRLLERGNIAYIAKPMNYWRINSGNARNSQTGILELAEGPAVISEIGRILKWEEKQVQLFQQRFKERYISTNE